MSAPTREEARGAARAVPAIEMLEAGRAASIRSATAGGGPAWLSGLWLALFDEGLDAVEDAVEAELVFLVLVEAGWVVADLR